jgi:predicted site-specific integrase-resolvase
VSSSDQNADLAVQSGKLRRYVEDRYAGGNHLHILRPRVRLELPEKGPQSIADSDHDRSGRCLVLNHKDRLLRFGAELVFKLCAFRNVRVVIVEAPSVERSFEQELAIFCARLYGKRSNRNKKMIGEPNLSLQC